MCVCVCVCVCCCCYSSSHSCDHVRICKWRGIFVHSTIRCPFTDFTHSKKCLQFWHSLAKSSCELRLQVVQNGLLLFTPTVSCLMCVLSASSFITVRIIHRQSLYTKTFSWSLGQHCYLSRSMLKMSSSSSSSSSSALVLGSPLRVSISILSSGWFNALTISCSLS